MNSHPLLWPPLQKDGHLKIKMFRLLSLTGLMAFIALALSASLVLSLRWVPPPTSAFILEKHLKGDSATAIRYRWIDWKSISPQMPLAVMAAEDQKFPRHRGFDLDSIAEAREKHKKGKRLRGASTITQQVAKNLFLWSGRNYLRKTLEAYFTVLLELFWSKQRILEVYMNVAEFGDGIFGVSAAADAFLGKHPSQLTREDAALLAAVLPNPKRLSARNPSLYVRDRRRWIEQQMEQLGGTRYLRDL
jgi:monofunctional biosynthetic peptidoglycan transglycosylase